MPTKDIEKLASKKLPWKTSSSAKDFFKYSIWRSNAYSLSLAFWLNMAYARRWMCSSMNSIAKPTFMSFLVTPPYSNSLASTSCWTRRFSRFSGTTWTEPNINAPTANSKLEVNGEITMFLSKLVQQWQTLKRNFGTQELIKAYYEEGCKQN